MLNFLLKQKVLKVELDPKILLHLFCFQTYLVMLLVTMGHPMQFVLIAVALHKVAARGFRVRENSSSGEGSSFYQAGQIFGQLRSS